MPSYIVLVKLTPRAKQNMPEALKARDRTWSEFEHHGLKITPYSTLGRFDSVLFLESPTEELVVRFLMAAGASGNIETETLRAFSEAESQKLRPSS